jgi:fatty acid desaturase
MAIESQNDIGFIALGSNRRCDMGTDITTSDTLTQELQTTITDLRLVEPRIGLFRFVTIGVVVFSLMALAWSVSNLFDFVVITAIAGIFYAFWIICSHDSVHQTLTGWVWFETIMPRLITWPMLWPHGTYVLLHRLHHGWNGIDLRDPERVQWTTEEYQRANPLLRWYVRYQGLLDIFILGGIGLIIKTFMHGWKLRNVLPQLQTQIWLDLTGILTIQGSLLLFFNQQGEIDRYILFWLILERTIGAIGQARDRLEHYGRWGQTGGYQLTQLYACRNLDTYPWIGWLMGGLNYHAVHHAFPDIPFNKLPEAFDRIQAVLRRHDLPLMLQGKGYVHETIKLGQHPSTIGAVDPQDVRGRYSSIAV